MGFKKKFVYKILGQALRNPDRLGRYLKRLLLTAAVIGVLLVTLTVFLIGYGVSQVSKIMSQQSDIGITALEGLVTEHALVLSNEQKTKIEPLLREFIQKEQISQEAQYLKSQIYSVLDSGQLELVKAREEKLMKEAENLSQFGRSTIEGMINKYIGITLEEGGFLLKNLSAWWQVNSPGNEAPEKLLELIESPQ